MIKNHSLRFFWSLLAVCYWLRGIYVLNSASRYKNTEEVTKRGDYLFVREEINSQNFPWRPWPKGVRKIKLLKFSSAISYEEIIARAKRCGLERPTYEDALAFGLLYCLDEPVMFLHEPWQDSIGRNVVIEVFADYSGRDLELCPVGGISEEPWLVYYAFVAP